jgi:hypothetical protein
VYTKGAPEVVSKRSGIRGKFSVSAAARAAGARAGGLGIVSLQLTGATKFEPYPSILGIGYEEINFEDNQPVPNHIHADLGPLGVVGVRVRF